jgi:hypothetical protein
MPIPKKRCAAQVTLHAALADTDPSDTSLILIKPAGYRAAFTPPPLLPLRRAPCQAARAPARPAMRDLRGPAPAWRRRPSRNSPVLPL